MQGIEGFSISTPITKAPSLRSSGGYTGMPVHLAEDGVPVCPNQVYIIPPDAILTIDDGILGLTRPARAAAGHPVSSFGQGATAIFCSMPASGQIEIEASIATIGAVTSPTLV